MNNNQPRGYSMGPSSGLTLQNPAEVDSISSQAYYNNGGMPPQYPPPEQTNYYGIDRAPPSYSQSYGGSAGSRRSVSRINPGQMPRPERPQTDLVYHTRSGSGRRNPPTVNSIYVAVDTGNCNPRHIRPTMVAPPHNADLLRQIVLPFAVHMTPFAASEPGEDPIPVIDFDQAPPPRCKRCGGYVNPSTVFLDQGYKWGCNLCEYVNIVPDWYYSALDGAKLRIDRLQRPEQIKGSVDYAIHDNLFPTHSIKKDNIIILAVDVSIEAVQKGFTLAAIRAIRSLAHNLLIKCQTHKANEEHVMQQRLASLQRDPYRPMYTAPSSSGSGPQQSQQQLLDYRLGIMTFHSQLQFFTADPTAASTADPVKLFVVDADDPFIPFPLTSWIYSLHDQADSLFTLLDKLPELLNRLSPSPIDKRQSGQGLLCPTAVINAVHSSLAHHQQGGGGRLYIFSSSHATTGWGSSDHSSSSSSSTSAAAQDGKRIFQQQQQPRESLSAYGTPDELLMYTCPGQTRPFLDRSRIDFTASLLETINGSSASATSNISSRTRVSSSQSKASSSQAGKIQELQAQASQYWELSSNCVDISLCVNLMMLVGDLYRDNQQPFIDTAPLADIAMITGGRLFLIRGDLLQEEAVLRLESQLLQDMSAVIGHEAIIKLRGSKGIGIEQVIGAGSFSALEEELRFSQVDSSTSTMFNLSLGGGGVTLKDEDKIHLQLACLYTTPLKQRRLRVHNLTLIASDKATVIYRNADIEAVACAIGRLAALKAFDHSLYSDDLRYGPRAILQQTLVEALVRYRKLCSAASPKGQLVLPESLKVLPMYILGLLKHPVFLENPPPSMYLTGNNNSISTPRLLQQSGSQQMLAGMTSPAALAASPASMSNARLYVHASERGVELRRFAAQPMKDLINAIYPRVFNLFAILDGDYFESNDNIAVPIPPPPQAAMILGRSDSRGSLDGHDESSSSLGLSLSQPPPRSQLLLAAAAAQHSQQREKLLVLHTLPASSAEFESDQIYIIDDQSYLWMFIGRALPQDLLEELFVLSPHNPYDRPDELVPRLDTSLGRKIEALLQLVSADCSYRPEMRVIWGDLGGGNRLLNKFSTRLVEDATGGIVSYGDFLLNVHQKIQGRMTS